MNTMDIMTELLLVRRMNIDAGIAVETIALTDDQHERLRVWAKDNERFVQHPITGMRRKVPGWEYECGMIWGMKFQPQQGKSETEKAES